MIVYVLRQIYYWITLRIYCYSKNWIKFKFIFESSHGTCPITHRTIMTNNNLRSGSMVLDRCHTLNQSLIRSFCGVHFDNICVDRSRFTTFIYSSFLLANCPSSRRYDRSAKKVWPSTFEIFIVVVVSLQTIVICYYSISSFIHVAVAVWHS